MSLINSFAAIFIYQMKSDHKHCSVLLIENSEFVSIRMKALIKEHAVCKDVHIAKDYSEAKLLIEQHLFSVIITDIAKPITKGLELIKYIKVKKNAPPIIVLTNRANQHYKSICKGLGADHFLDKSVEFDKIPQMINSQITD